MKNWGVVLSFIGIVLILIVGCLEREKFERVAPINVTTVSTPNDTSSGIDSVPPEGSYAYSTVAPTLTYPYREDAKKYVADLKKVPQDEVKIIDFHNIGAANMIPYRAYHSRGYVAVSMIITNYTSLVLAYKNHSNVIIIGNYTASTNEEKELFDLLTNITFDHPPFYGNLIPTNITIINSSYTINKNDVYKIGYKFDSPHITMIYGNYTWYQIENPYAVFEFVTRFNDYHGYWPESYGWIDAKKKQIWIKTTFIV